MGDAPNMEAEDILAEPDEPSFSPLTLVLGFLHAYGWYIIAAAIAIYYFYKNRESSSTSSGGAKPKTSAELKDWQSKEEQRQQAIQRLQAKYAVDAAARAERQKEIDEQKRKARLEEKEKLTGKIDVGKKVGEDEKSKKFRPEYNPLMGDAGSSGRVCFRRPGGGGGG